MVPPSQVGLRRVPFTNPSLLWGPGDFQRSFSFGGPGDRALGVSFLFEPSRHLRCSVHAVHGMSVRPLPWPSPR